MSPDRSIAGFNGLPAERAAELLRSCLDVPRWVEQVLAGRPYGDRGALLTAARVAADPLTEAEVRRALARHPRIGERPSGEGAEAAMSRREQAGVDRADADLAARLRAGNEAYEQRFGHVFLIRAAGRSAAEMLEALRQRLAHDPVEELAVVAGELREIALLRLEGALDQ